MVVLRIYYRQTNYQQSNSNNTNMIPKQQNVNDYGFKFNHKDMISPTKYGINSPSKNQMTAKFYANYPSTGSNPLPNSTTNAQNQQNKVLGFRRKYPHHKQGHIINSKHYFTQYNTKEKETNKYQNSHPSTTESLRSDHQIFGDHPKLINKQVKLIEKLGENNPKYHTTSQKTQTEAFYDLLYKIIGILSCHVRVNQRLALYRIMQSGESVKKQSTEFYFLIRSLIIKRLKNGMLCLKQLATHSKNKQIKQQLRHRMLEKPSIYEELKDQNFQMEQSAVVKGLKFLQDRSNLRRRTQQQTVIDKKQIQEAEKFSDKKKTELGLKSPKQNGGEINLRNDPYLTANLKIEQIQVAQMMPKNINRVQSQQNLISGNNIPQFKTDVNKKSIHRQSSESIKNLPKITINSHLNQRSVSKKQPMEKNLNLQRQSVISRLASWVILQLQQQPYIGLQNRKQLFERVETSERKYYLNPNAYKQAEPDTNHNLLALSSRSSVDEVEIYDEADNEQINLYNHEQNTGQNQHSDTFPMFQYGHNDNVIQSWDVKQAGSQKNKNSSNKASKANVYKNSQAEFENLPSFNEKNALIYKKANENQKETFHDKLGRDNKTDTMQQKKGEQMDKQKRKTAQQIKNQIKSSKQSSFKISDEDYSVEEKMQEREHASKYSANKVHQIEEYFTDSNIFQQKNKKKIKLKEQNIRSSYDFPLHNQEIANKNANLPFQRPKSISASSNQLNRPLFGLKQERVLQKNKNPMIRSQTLLPRININYQSPRNYVISPNTHSNKVVYQNIQSLQLQPQIHRQSQPVIQAHSQQTKPNNYFRSQNKIYAQKGTQINSPNRVYNSGSFFHGPNALQMEQLQRNQNYQATNKPEKNQYRIDRSNNQASYQNIQMVSGQRKIYVRASYGLNSPRQVIQSRPTSYSAYQEGIQTGGHKNPTYIYQNQVPRHPTQSNQRYLNINKSPIKKGIDICHNPMSNTVWNERMLKHSKSDQLLNSLHTQGNEQTVHKNNKKLKVTTAEYY